ncbi:MAG: hypothetical protein GXP22_08150 [Gammaproteobacteria bacterium]|nr:hypothetical protein [Gammaproteobacteria bacterium]
MLTSISRLLLLSIGLLLATMAQGSEAIKTCAITIIFNPQNETHQSVQQALNNGLQQEQNTRCLITAIDYTHNQKQTITRNQDLVVSIGSKASEWAINKVNQSPLLAIMVSSEKYKSLSTRFPGQLSAIVIDQPIARYYQLIKASMPDIQHVNTVFGSHSRKRKPEMVEQAKNYAIKLHSYTLSTHDTVLDALNRIMTKYNSVLLTLPDPAVINRRSIRSILLHAYHKNTPVFGFSSNYVRAGAIAAVFTTPDQFGREAADEIILRADNKQFSSTQMKYPSRYDIKTNTRVIKSMNLVLPSLAEIRKRMRAQP